MLRIIPGDPATVLLNEHVSQANIERLTESMGLDKSLPEQFFGYMAGLLRGDLGRSYYMQQPVASLIREAFPFTLRLTLLAIIFAWTLGIFSGVISAMYNEYFLDYLFRGMALFGISIPVFMVALFLQYLFYYRLSLLPLTYDGSIGSLILPAVALGWNSAGSVARLVRSGLIEELREPYMDTARAKGLVYRKAVIVHALRNAALPVITMMALQLSGMLSGAVITESVFVIPGIGRLALTAVQTRDMPLLQGTVLFTAFLIALGNILADVINTLLDPRLRTI
ncbi:MAG: ABC transporter permease [Lachnospiraceae bacterium]|nr:ABC transporter permease [Lachnospiraceae bacterium]